MTFNESNTVEEMILVAASGKATNGELKTGASGITGKEARPSFGNTLKPDRWDYIPAIQIPRQPGDVLVES